MPPKLAYSIAIPRPETHLVEVRLRIAEIEDREEVRLELPAWTPGSYSIRDFARHVQDFEARGPGGRALKWERTSKLSWRIGTRRARVADVAYRVYANDFGVQTSHVDPTHAFLNGSNLFVYLAGEKDLPAELVVEPPRGWVVDTGLPAVAGRRNAFTARGYDHLADCPLEVGTHRRLSFRALGKEHRVALYGRGNEDERRIVRDLKRIAEEEAAIFGEMPYDDYLFIIHLLDKAGGGLEHENSNASAVHRFTFEPAKKYEDFLALEAHELFHAWNVKRIRPRTLGPFDYSREVYTSLLWAMEGLTSYYDHLVLARAGLITEERYRDYLGEMITKYREQPGRRKMSLEESSFLTWIKLYKPDENWPNTGMSYYLKGELVGAVLDLSIRDRTEGKKSLDHVFRRLWEEHGRAGEGIEEADGWRAVLERETGLSWKAFWRKHVSGVDELDFDGAFRPFGWRLVAVREPEKPAEAAKKGEYATMGGNLGVVMKEVEGRVRVKHVLSGSPAERAGLLADDELVAFDNFRIRDPEFLKNRLRERDPGEVVELRVFRRDELLAVRVTLGDPPPSKWKLVTEKRVSARAKRLRRAWLAPRGGPRIEPAPAGGAPPRPRGARSKIVERGE